MVAPDDDEENVDDMLSKFRAGAVHTVVVATHVAVPLGDASLRTAVTSLSKAALRAPSLLKGSGEDNTQAHANGSSSSGSKELDRSSGILSRLLAQVGWLVGWLVGGLGGCGWLVGGWVVG